jgi:hypothetical protein
VEFKIWDGDAAGQAPNLQPLIGRKVQRAWILPESQTLVLKLEGKKFVMFERVKSIGFDAVSVETGNEIPGADFSDLAPYGTDPHLLALRGMPFTGMDGIVVHFGDSGNGPKFGARMERDCIKWVARP